LHPWVSDDRARLRTAVEGRSEHGRCLENETGVERGHVERSARFTAGLGRRHVTEANQRIRQVAPNPSLRMPTIERGDVRAPHRAPTLQQPFAERAHCERRGAGVAAIGNDDRLAVVATPRTF